jgi:hypothetical protein
LNASIIVPGVSSGHYGYEMSSSMPLRYYVTDLSSKIFIFDEDWNYVSFKLIQNNVYNIIRGVNYYYITVSTAFLKTDQQLNILITYNLFRGYLGLYYNSTIDSILVAPASLHVIHVFNFNLALTDTISIPSYNPWSINAYNDQLYVGTTNGTILVIVNKQIIKQFNGCNGQSVSLFSILFDQFDKIATACEIISPLYLLKTNGTYLNKNILTVDYPFYIGFDSKSRLVVVTSKVIFVYN